MLFAETDSVKKRVNLELLKHEKVHSEPVGRLLGSYVL